MNLTKGLKMKASKKQQVMDSIERSVVDSLIREQVKHGTVIYNSPLMANRVINNIPGDEIDVVEMDNGMTKITLRK